MANSFFVYLDNRILSDLVSVQNDGVVAVVNHTHLENDKNSLSGDVGVSFTSQVLAVFKGSADVNVHSGNETEAEKQTAFQKYFTSGSLFEQLKKDGKIELNSSLEASKEGDLVEFKGSLTENTVRDIVQKISVLCDGIEAYFEFERTIKTLAVEQKCKEDYQNLPREQKNKTSVKKLVEVQNEAINAEFGVRAAQLKLAKALANILLDELEQDDHALIVCDQDNGADRIIFVLENEFLMGRRAHELTGGKYNICGKLLCKHDGYNVLRTTTLSLLAENQLNALFDVINNDELREMFNVSDLQPIIRGRVYEVYPLAIYV